MPIIIASPNRNFGMEARGTRRVARVATGDARYRCGSDAAGFDARYRCGSDAAGFAAFTVDINNAIEIPDRLL